MVVRRRPSMNNDQFADARDALLDQPCHPYGGPFPNRQSEATHFHARIIVAVAGDEASEFLIANARPIHLKQKFYGKGFCK